MRLKSVLALGLALVLALAACSRPAEQGTAGPSAAPAPAPASASAPPGTQAGPPPKAPPPAVPITQVITAHAVDPAKIERVSKFRSMIGHGAPQYQESDRSMKHYFMPLASLNSTEKTVPVLAPAAGTVVRVADETPRPKGSVKPGEPNPPVASGQQVHLQARDNPALVFVLFHIDPVPGLAEGKELKAGEQIGWADTQGNSFDIAVEVRDANGASPVSYFELLPSELWADWERRGIPSRDQLILTREYRDAHPLPFNSPEALREGWVVLKPPIS